MGVATQPTVLAPAREAVTSHRPIRLVNCALTTADTASVSAAATFATSNAPPPSRPTVSIASIRLAHSWADGAVDRAVMIQAALMLKYNKRKVG